MAQSAFPHKHPETYHPSSLKTREYDVICIGSGWAARPIASRMVQAGYTTLLIDNEGFGGDCPYWACVPSKALLRPAEALEGAKNVGGAREQVNSASVHVEAVLSRRTAFTRDLDDEKLLVPAILETGTHIVRGTGKIAGEKKVEVTSLQGEVFKLSARHAVAVCTGSVPTIPNIPGLQEVQPWTPREATSASVIPNHLVILGGGAVGCEMATAFNSFGSRVTLISSSSEILPTVDPEAGAIVRERFQSDGTSVYTSTRASRVSRKATDQVEVELSSGQIILASEILVAAGRRPRTDGCGLEKLGLKTDGSPIEVDESLCVKQVPGGWLYAVGDVNGRAPMTHMCKYQARIASNAMLDKIRGTPPRNNLWGISAASADHHAVPRVVFTRPTVSAVGLTSKSAAMLKKNVRIVTALAASIGALLHSDVYSKEAGWAQWVIDRDSNRLLGMTIVGEDAQELIHGATVAIVSGITLDRLAHVVPSFPTMSEVYLNLADAAGL